MEDFLTLSQSEFEEWARRVSELLEDYRLQVDTRPIIRVGQADQLRQTLWEPLPAKGVPASVIFAQLKVVLDNLADLTHPRFFAFVPSPGNQISAFADYLISELNIFAGSWLEASGPAVIEQLVIDWFRSLIGYTTGAGGLFLSGGSLANLTAIVVARTHKLGDDWQKGTVYCSDQTHSSIRRALKILGFQDQQLRILESDNSYRIPIEQLQDRIDADRKSGFVPFCIVANAGTTNTGAVDPIRPLSDIAVRHNMWLHVDGAYGLPAMFVDSCAEQFDGIDKADSISVDPHKWLFQNYSCAVLLMANKDLLFKTFASSPEYLRDASTDQDQINFWDYGPELTRPFRALKLWLSIKAFGFDEFRQAIEKGRRLAELMQQAVSNSPDWQIISPANNGICCFRYSPADVSEGMLDEINGQIANQMKRSGRSVILSTTLRTQTVLRICTINPRTSESDLLKAMEELKLSAKEVLQQRSSSALSS